MKLKIIHSWNLPLHEARILQEKLSRQINLNSAFKSIKEIKTIAGCDTYFKNGKITASIVILSFPKLKLVEKLKITKKDSYIYPYIKEFLSFREGPILTELLQQVKTKPDITIFEGQGTANQKKIDVATHMGILFDVPTIGFAENYLFGQYIETLNSIESRSYLKDSEGKIIGKVIYMNNFTKPIFISPGYNISVDLSAEVISNCCIKTQIPEPLRLAYILSQEKK